ncbi:MAG TPA: HAD family phosphatase, partial [Dehalococcoidia bacterium]|nr:HAD family phosphatase [Dehalococcoidia bacterium]
LKPDPAFFQRILGGLGAPPEECVFIDDRPENVESARTLGIDALHFQSLEKLETD